MDLEKFDNFSYQIVTDDKDSTNLPLDYITTYEYYGKNKDVLLIVGECELGNIFIAVDTSTKERLGLYNILTYTIGSKPKVMDAYNEYKEKYGWILENKKGENRMKRLKEDTSDKLNTILQKLDPKFHVFAVSQKERAKNREYAVTISVFPDKRLGKRVTEPQLEEFIIDTVMPIVYDYYKGIGIDVYYDNKLHDLENFWDRSRTIKFSVIFKEDYFYESRKGVKTMKKRRFTEAMDIDDLINDYGEEYLRENDPDSEVFEMDMFDELMYGKEPLDIALSLFYGGRYSNSKEPFNPNDPYFRFDGYGNPESIPSKRDKEELIRDAIDEDYFIEWCKEQGYVDDDDDF